MFPGLAMLNSERFRTLASLFAGLAIVIAMVIATVWYSAIGRQAAEYVREAVELRGLQAETLSVLKDAETGQRGYLLTGEDPFLEPLRSAVAVMPGMLEELETHFKGDPMGQQALGKLRDLIRQRIDIANETTDLHRRGDGPAAAAIVLSGRGRETMNAARNVVQAMTSRQDTIIAGLTERANNAWLTLQVLILASALALILLAAVAILTTNRSMRRMAAAQKLAEDALAERDRAETQLRHSQKIQAVGQLTGGIAHDFNNMLAIVIGSLNLAKRRLPDAHKAEQYIDHALEGGRRAAELTARLLAFSRQQPLDPRAVDLNKLVSGMTELLRRTLGETVHIETVLGGGVWRTFIDAPQLESALVNLCVNARDAMPEGGKLTIETGNAHLDDAYAAAHVEVKAGQYVVVAVTDSGIGMSKEVIERAFDPFYTTKGPGKGTGLGLSQVFGFVKQSGGHIKLYSEIGQGTTVRMYLPRHMGADAAETPVAAAVEVQRGDPNIVILAVEDDERVRRVTVDALRELGYTVVQASSANQAMTLIEAQPRVDLLFTDVVMPDVNGRVLADQARAKKPNLKVVFTTGYTQNAVVHNGMLDPGVVMLQKPFTIEQLAAKIRTTLDSK